MKIFVDEGVIETKVISGENAHYISRVLRAKIGDEIVLGRENLQEYFAKICEISRDEVRFEVLKAQKNENELPVKISLFQCLPKGDKLDDIVKKSVELGASEIVPVLSSRCVSRPDEKSSFKKIARWNAISLNSAQQARRGVVSKVGEIINFKQAVTQAKTYDLAVLFYENGGQNLKEILNKSIKSIAILIGPEGGFSPEEVEFAKGENVKLGTLGKRILRTETAPIAALSVLAHLVESD